MKEMVSTSGASVALRIVRFAWPVLAAMASGGCGVSAPSVGMADYIAEDTAGLACEREENAVQPQIGKRRRLAKETLLYAEFLSKYGMFQNYLHYWIDRPLYCDRALRPETFAYETPESFAVHGAQLRKAGLDGLDVFVSARRNGQNARLDGWFEKAGTPELNILPIVSYGEAIDRRGPDVKGFAAAVREVQGGGRATRINGKALVPTYNYRMFNAEQHKAFMRELKAELGNDDFILCGDVNQRTLARLQGAFRRNGALSAAETNELETALREVLDATGGIQLTATEKIRIPDGQYCTCYDLSFFEKCTAPLVERLLALPEYREKVLGFYVHQGYVNHMTGHDASEEGTFTLRSNLASVLRLNPDYLIFFEWNEVNENTMFQPTVWGGHVAGRILRWHSRFLKGLAPDPYPGDDVSIPPLALTYRATAKCGEVLHFELLNVPDGVWTRPVKAQLRLDDIEGRRIAAFPVETVDPAKLGSIDYRISTIGLRGGTVLVPTLVADGRLFDGFSPIRIDPTVSWLYKTVRQSLRERLVPKGLEASVRKGSDGMYAFSVKGDFGEPLASVELIENENEHTACGIEGEYDFAGNAVLRLAFTVPRDGVVRGGEATVRVEGASGCRFTPLWLANVDPGKMRMHEDGSGFTVNTLFWTQETAYFIQVPKPQLDTAKICVTFRARGDDSFVPAEFSAKTVADRGLAGAVINPRTAHRVDIRRVFDLPDLPPHIKSPSVDWHGRVETRTPYPVWHFRAIAESGRIWRSRPFRAEAIPSGDVQVPVFDEVAHRPAVATSPAALVPRLRYDFDPAGGATLKNSWNPFFDAYLGGGIFYSEAYSGVSTGKIEPGDRAPKWVQDDGRWCLMFDGVNDYVNFPREAFPQAAYTLTMEVKPEFDAKRPMTLFRHFCWIRGSLSLFIRDGELFARWGDKDLSKEPGFRTGLKVMNGEWNEIVASYDFREFAFRVNGQEMRFPWSGRAWAFKPAIFGGHDKAELGCGKGKPSYFKGLLRRLDIEHNCKGRP